MSDSPKAWIDRAGGYRLVARRLEESPTTVHNWTRSDTFPLAQYHALRAMAKELDLPPPADRLFPFKELPPAKEAGASQ